MTNEIQKLWNDQHSVAVFTQTEQLQEKTTKFERTVRARNILEFTALTVVLALFIGGAVLSIAGQKLPFAAAFLACRSAFLDFLVYITLAHKHLLYLFTIRHDCGV